MSEQVLEALKVMREKKSFFEKKLADDIRRFKSETGLTIKDIHIDVLEYRNSRGYEDPIIGNLVVDVKLDLGDL